MKPKQTVLIETDDDPRPLRVKGWDEHFETAESRKKYKALGWFRHPVSFNSTGYQNLLDCFEPCEAMALYGCWEALCQVAATAPVRGVLAGQNGEPYTVNRIARLACVPGAAKVFKKLIDWALTVGWLEHQADTGQSVGEHQADTGQSVGEHQADTGQSVGEHQESSSATLRDVTRRDETKPHPTSDSGVGDSSELSSDWPSVERELANCGVSLAKQACVEAKSNGSTPETVAKLIVHYRDHPGAWGPAALFLRVKSPAVSLSVSDGWPKPSEEYAARQRKEQAARDAQRQRNKSAEKLAELDEHKKKLESVEFALNTLEKEIGHELDELPISELLQLAPAGPARKTVKAKGWRAPLVRSTILRAYQDRVTNDEL